MGLFEEKKRANQSNIDRHTKAVELAIGRRRSRGPILPPNPFYTRLVCTRKVWPPVTSARLKVKTNYDVDKLKTLTETIPFDRLGKLKRGYLFEYFLSLVKWVQLIRDEDEEHRGYMRDFPSDLTYTLAKQIGRLAAASSDGDAWKTLTDLNRMLSKGELIGIYLDAVVHDLMASGRPPDDRFWRAWRPAADWVMSTLVPKRGQVRSQELENAVLTAGFVGPYITSIPPDWPHLELLLPRIKGSVTSCLEICPRNAFLAPPGPHLRSGYALTTMRAGRRKKHWRRNRDITEKAYPFCSDSISILWSWLALSPLFV